LASNSHRAIGYQFIIILALNPNNWKWFAPKSCLEKTQSRILNFFSNLALAISEILARACPSCFRQIIGINHLVFKNNRNYWQINTLAYFFITLS
jgi:hypothetical protein